MLCIVIVAVIMSEKKSSQKSFKRITNHEIRCVKSYRDLSVRQIKKIYIIIQHKLFLL